MIVPGRSRVPDPPKDGKTRPSAISERAMKESPCSDYDLLSFLLEQIQKLGEEDLRVTLTRFIQESLNARNRRPDRPGDPRDDALSGTVFQRGRNPEEPKREIVPPLARRGR